MCVGVGVDGVEGLCVVSTDGGGGVLRWMDGWVGG